MLASDVEGDRCQSRDGLEVLEDGSGRHSRERRRVPLGLSVLVDERSSDSLIEFISHLDQKTMKKGGVSTLQGREDACKGNLRVGQSNVCTAKPNYVR